MDRSRLPRAGPGLDREQLGGIGLAVTGRVEQPHVVKWSTVLRVPTQAGPVWFTANDGSLRHEAGVTALLSARHPANVPPLLAAAEAALRLGWVCRFVNGYVPGDDPGARLRMFLDGRA